MQIDSTSNMGSSAWLNSWVAPAVIIAFFVLLFNVIKYCSARKETKPRLNDAKINESSFRTFSFVIANNRSNSITVLKIYYRIFHFDFIPSKKYKFQNGWEYPTNREDPLFKKTVIEKEQSFIIPLAKHELTLDKKHKIYVKTSGGLCVGTVRPWVHSQAEKIENEARQNK